MKGANEFADLKAKVEILETEVTVLGSVLEVLHYADPTLLGAQGPPSPPTTSEPASGSPTPDSGAPGSPAPDSSGPASTEAGSPAPPDDHDGDPEEPIVPFFGSLLEFVVEHFGPVYARNTSPTVRWCANWWDHAEAIYRLEALWRTWELYRLEPRLGIASWLRDYLDPQLRELTSATGPFASCTEDRHSPVKGLRTHQPPEDYLVDL